MQSCRQCVLLMLLLCLSGSVRAAPAASPRLLVFAASSLTNVLDEVGSAYMLESGQQVTFSYGASSTLARQLEAGAKADVFFSADTDWMDYVQSRGLIQAASRNNLLGNQLVLVAPADSDIQLRIKPGFALAAALGRSRLATGDPDSVPVGKYARSALIYLGVWNEVANKLVRADNVRTALAFVAKGEAPLGIVYATDALIDKQVRIVDTFPDNTHVPVVYPVALVSQANEDAAKFVKYLRSATAQAVFRKYGFTALP
jgi:molybdate transport system substrate-binding protein